jgi:hypothetical protein
MRDVLLLMEDGPYSTRAFGMRHPYGQAARNDARSVSGTLWAWSAPKDVPRKANAPTSALLSRTQREGICDTVCSWWGSVYLLSEGGNQN